MRQQPPVVFTPKACALHVACALALHEALPPTTAQAQAVRPNQIVTDGRTATTLNSAGAVTDVRTGTVSGANAYNSFSAFNVGQGQTVNLHVPAASSNLINIVRDQRATVDGVLNAIKDGKIGGNVHFATPNGMLVSATGVVNVGSLTVTTPTREFTDKLFIAPGVPNEAAVAQLQSGNAPRNTAAQVVIDGKVNAAGNVTLHAGSINVGGTVYSGARFTGSAPHFTDVVNANGIAQGTRLVERNGRIEIVADNDVRIAGTLAAPGSEGVRGGDITVRAGNNITLDAGAKLIAAGDGARSPGGTVYVMAANNAVIHKGALIDASAGKSGDGGAIEFSASKNVELAGGEFRADALAGRPGAVLIDPVSITVSANILRGASGYGVLPDGATASSAAITLKAEDSITVNSDVTISSRLVGSDHVNGLSLGDSGNITLEAPSIRLLAGARVLAHANNGFGGGTVTLTADKTSTSSLMGFRSANSLIEIGDAIRGATIKGQRIFLTATTLVDTRYLYSESVGWVDDTINIASRLFSASMPLAFALDGQRVANSESIGSTAITVKRDSVIEGETVTLRAENTTYSGTTFVDSAANFIGSRLRTPLGLGLVFALNQADAKVTVQDGAIINARNLSLRSHNTATLQASIAGGEQPTLATDTAQLALAAGVALADIKAKTTVERGATLNVGGALTVQASNVNRFALTVEAQALASGRGAFAVAYSDFKSSAQAELLANVADASSVGVVAINDNRLNATSASSQAGSTLNNLITAGAKQKIYTSLTDSVSDKLTTGLFGDQSLDKRAAPTQVKFRFGGSVALANTRADTVAVIGDQANIHATGDIFVGANTLSKDMQVAAESTATSQSRDRAATDTSRQSYSAAVTLGAYEHDALAKVGAGATLTAERIGITSSTVIPLRETLLAGNTGFESFDRWTSAGTILQWFGALTNNTGKIINIFDVFNGHSAASATSDGSQGAIALGGSVNVLNYVTNTRSVVDAQAKLQLTGTQTGAWSYSVAQIPGILDDPATSAVNESQAPRVFAFDAPLHVRADHESKLLFLGGGLPLNSSNIGVSYTQSTLTNSTEAIVREGVVMQGVTESVATDANGQRTFTVAGTAAAGGIAVTANSKDFHLAIASAGGLSDSFGINGAVSITKTSNTTHALIDDETIVNAKNISLKAGDTPVAWSIAGAVSINLSEKAAVGVGIGYNDLLLNTRATAADNDSLQGELSAPRVSLLNRTNPGAWSGDDVTVDARSGGLAKTIGVTGGVLKNTPGPSALKGLIESYKNFQDWALSAGGVLNSADSSYFTPDGSSKLEGGFKLATTGKPRKLDATFGLTGAASAAANEAHLVTESLLEGITLTQSKAATAPPEVRTLTVSSIADLDIVAAAGGAAFSISDLDSQKKSGALSGAVTINIVDNKNTATLRDSAINNAQDIHVRALQGGETLSTALALSVDASSKVDKSIAFSGSVSLGFTTNIVTAGIENTKIAADGAGSDTSVTAYNRSFIGTGAGALGSARSPGAGVGASLTYGEVNNTTSASIAASDISGMETIDLRAINAVEIGAGAASAALTFGKDSTELQGSGAVNLVTASTSAAITSLANISASKSINVEARGAGADTLLEQTIDPGGKRNNAVPGIDYCGRTTMGAGGQGSCITAVAGAIGIGLNGSSSVGASFAYNSIENAVSVTVENSALNVTGGDGIIRMRSVSEPTITGVAAGIGVASKFAGAGSATVNLISNSVTTSVTAPAGNATYKSLQASKVEVSALDKSRIDTAAGQLVGSKEGAAIGAAVTFANIAAATKTHANAVNIDALGTFTLSANNDSRIRSLAGAGAVVTGGEAPAVSASIAVNLVGNTTEATSHLVTFDNGGSAPSNNTISIGATDTSAIRSLAGAVAGGAKAAGGGAFAYNGIANTTTAAADDSTFKHAAGVTVAAKEGSTIETLSAAVGGGQTLAISGSISINRAGRYGDSGNPDQDGNVTTARLKNSVVENASSAVAVSAEDTSTIKSLAGGVAISLDTAGVGGAVADNSMRNVALASIEQSSLQNAASIAVDAKNNAKIQSLSAAAAGAKEGAFAGSASSNRTTNRTIAEIARAEATGSSANTQVTSTDSASIQSLSGAAALALGGAAFGAAISVSRIDNTTDARVSSAYAPTSNGLQVNKLLVKADSAESIETIAASGAGGKDVGAAGSLSVNRINNNTWAHLDGGQKVAANQFVGVIAEADDLLTVGAGAAGVGLAAAGVAASVVVNTIDGSTKAWISGPGTEVSARDQSGSPGLTVANGALTKTPDLLSGITQTAAIFKRPDLAALRATEEVHGLAVNASATHHMLTFVTNIGAGTVGVAGGTNVNIIGGSTEAYIDQARINGGDNTSASKTQGVQVKASDHAYGNMFVGTVAGGTTAGIGLMADVAVFDRATRAYVKDATLTATGALAAGAQSTQGMSTVVVAGALGQAALVGAGSAVKFTSETDANVSGGTLTMGSLDVTAKHDTHMFVSAGTGAAGLIGAGASFDVALDGSATRAHLDGATIHTGGKVSVDAQAASNITEWTVALSGGAASVAGTASVVLIENTTQAWASGSTIGGSTQRAASLTVRAKDTVAIQQIAGAGALAGVAGVGLAAGAIKVQDTVSAYLNNVTAYTTGDITIDAQAARDIASTVATAGGALVAGVSGSVGVVLVGRALDQSLSGDANATRELDANNAGTLSEVQRFSGGERLTAGKNLDAPSGNQPGLEAGELAAINQRGKIDVQTAVYAVNKAPEVSEAFDPATQLTGRVAAISGGVSTLDAQGKVTVSARETDRVRSVTGSGALGSLAGLGGAVSIAQVTNNVDAGIIGAATVNAGTGLSVSAATANLDANSPAVRAQAVQASGGAVGLGAAVAVGTANNEVNAAIGRGTTITVTTGDASVTATDTATVKSSALGAIAGPLLAAGAVISRATRNGTMGARIGNTAAASTGTDTTFTLGNGTLTLDASRSGAVSADARGGAGGIIAGVGAEATAADKGNVTARIGNSTEIEASTNDVNANASFTPQVSAASVGVAATGVTVGVSLANAVAATNVTAALGDNATVTADNFTLGANRLFLKGSHSLSADASGSSIGALMGINAAISSADISGTVSTTAGTGATLKVADTARFSANSQTDQYATATGLTIGGALAVGAIVANANANTTTTAATGNQLTAEGGTLSVLAEGADANTAKSTSGSGGLVSGAGAAANTSNTAAVSASIGGGDATHAVNVSALLVKAAQTNAFNGEVNSTNAALVGASGAVARHVVNSTVNATLGNDARVRANDIALRADNASRMDWLGGTADGANWNIKSGSGGAVDAAAASSGTTVSHATTATIGDRADIHVLAPVAGEGKFNADAFNAITGHVKALVDSGGVIPIPLAFVSFNVASANATVNIGSDARIVSDLGNINAGASGHIDLDVRANANAYGIAGQPAGKAYAEYSGANTLTINPGALLHADDGAVFLGAGHSSAGTQAIIKAFADVHLWNKTAFPLINPPDPRVIIASNATLTLPAGAAVEAAGDVSLMSSRGTIDGSFAGVGKDIYREGIKEAAEFFGADNPNYDVTGGTLRTSGLALVHVDGVARTGIQRDQFLTLDYQLVDLAGRPSAVPVRDPVTGLVLWRLVPVASKGVTFTLDPARSIEQGIRDRIAKLRSLMSQYAGDPASVAAYRSEIQFLEAKLVQLGYANVDANGNLITGANNPSPRKAAEQQLRIYESQLAGASGTINNAAATVASTAASASTSEATILTSAAAIDTQQTTINGNNNTIDTALRGLAGFNAANASYAQLNNLRTANTTLQGEINTRRAQNSTDRTTVNTKTTELNTLLGEVNARNTQIEQIVQANPADAAAQITTLRGEVETRQTVIAARVSEINTMLTTISTRNTEIKTRADGVAANNTQIDTLQGTVATAFGGAATIAPLRGNNDAPRASVTASRDTISNEQNLFAAAGTGYVPVAAAQNNSIATAQNDKGALPALIADLNAQLPNLSTVAANGAIADYIRVNDITARLGNLYTAGDRLAGSGTLAVPGDARITITNNTPSFLVLGKMTIPADEGGALRFNGGLVNSNFEIRPLNRGAFQLGVTPQTNLSIVTRDTQGAAPPSITVRSNYDPNSPLFANLPAPAPDVFLNGDISNLRGSVTVHSKAGSILSGGAINAATIDVKADNGDFVQSFVNGFSHAGGDPASIQDFGRPLGAGIVANGGVFISARFLNINSLVQSGIDNWIVNLPAAPVITGPVSMFGLNAAAVAIAQAQYDALSIFASPPTTQVFPTAAGNVTYNFVTRRVEAPLSWADADRLLPDWATRTAATNGLYQLPGAYGNLAAFYNPVAQRIELNGAQVRGGYIQLYGQIINTTDTAGAAKLRALDGFGQIRVTNASGVPVVVNNLDTGADAAGNGRGTAGKIDITDIQSARADGSVDIIHTVFTRDFDPASGQGRVMRLTETGAIDKRGTFTATSTTGGADGAAPNDRNAVYNPQSGLRYVWTTATDQSTEKYWTFKSDKLFGLFEVTQPSGTVVAQSGPYTLGVRRLDDGTYLKKVTGGPEAGVPLLAASDTRGVSDQWIQTGVRTECNWWTVCIAQFYYQDYTQKTATQTITTKSLKADYPIAIEFGGVNRGVLAVNSASDVLVNGSLANRAGTLTLSAGNSGTGVTNPGKSIAQINPNALITAKDINLSATGNIGTDAATALRFNLSGAFSASTTNGNIFVHQATGGLQAGTITAAGDATQGLGRIGLSTDGDITAAPGASLIQGNRVDLESANGKIGSITAPLTVNTGMPADPLQRGFYGLKAAAQGDIGITSGVWSGNAKGDLLVNTVVSRGGDVRLAAPGRIIDNNPIETIDQRTWNQLLAYWDSIALRANTTANADKQAQAVRAFENGKTQDYRLYWQIRQRQATPAAYDPAFVYSASAAERDALTNAGLTSTQITQFETSRTTQYHRLHSEVGALNGGAFAANYAYTADISLQKQILNGSSWTERELGISLTPALLKDITNTNPVIKAANAQGRRVTLEAGTAIGETPSAITILASTLPENLSAEQKVALAAAERADVDLSVPGQISILQRRPVNFDASAALTATVAPSASGHADAGRAFLASPGDARIDTFNVAGDARVKVRGSIVHDSATSPDVQAGNLILEAANGGIGSATAPLRLRLATGAALTARAAEGVSINATAGNLSVDTVFSRKDVSLAAQGSILDAHAPFAPPSSTVRETDLNVLGENITLVSRAGGIGEATNALDVGVNLNGTISATAQTTGNGIYLNGPIGRPFNLAHLLSGGAVDLRAAGDLTLGGAVSGTDVVRLVTGGALNMSAASSVRATTQGVFVDAQSLTMADGASIKVDTGAIDIRTTGDAVITGIETGNPTASAVTIVSSNGRILDGGNSRLDIIADAAPAATITLNGAKGVGNDPLDIRALNLAATSGGVADIAVQNGVNIVSITAADRVLLTAGGNITGGTVTSSGTGTNADKSVSITSTSGNINLAAVNGTADVRVSAPATVAIGSVSTGGAFALTGDKISANITAPAGATTPTQGAITGLNGAPATDIQLTAANPAGYTFTDVLTQSGGITITLGDATFANLLAVNRLTVKTPLTNLLIDQNNFGYQPFDVQLYSGGAPIRLAMSGRHVDTSASVLFRGPLHEVISPNGSASSDEQAARVLDNAARVSSSSDVPATPSVRADSPLISFSGTPVALPVALCTDNKTDCP